MDRVWKKMIWDQFGAAIDTLENALTACPEDLWRDESREPRVWYEVYHALFWLDLHAHGSVDGFAPPPPFNLDELDPAGVLPPRAYSKDELRLYLEYGREKCRAAVESMTEEKAMQRCVFGWGEVSFAELCLYSMRHVQHHAARLNQTLRRELGWTPKWVAKAHGIGERIGERVGERVKEATLAGGAS